MEYKIILSKYDLYVIEEELNLRIMKLKSMRDKVGILVDDQEAEPNQHIKSIKNLLNQLGLKTTLWKAFNTGYLYNIVYYTSIYSKGFKIKNRRFY